jgi:cytochrome c oxidase cbb3-type subunit 1
MDKSTVWFLYMSLIYLAIGALLGLLMIFVPPTTGAVYRVHGHINLLGWISMMIFGVAYHILPRFSGQPVKYPRFIWPHFWLTNVGLVGMGLSWVLGASGSKAWEHVAGVFGLAASLGIGLFIYNMLATIQMAPPVAQPQKPPA